jgi:hypothetical protein
MAAISRENFQQLEYRCTEPLLACGFYRDRHEYDGAFGSHYVDFVYEGSAYRLIGDGRESAIFLDHSSHYYEAIQQQDWQTLLHRPFPVAFNSESMESLSSVIEGTLSTHLAQNAP